MDNFFFQLRKNFCRLIFATVLCSAIYIFFHHFPFDWRLFVCHVQLGPIYPLYNKQTTRQPNQRYRKQKKQETIIIRKIDEISREIIRNKQDGINDNHTGSR